MTIGSAVTMARHSSSISPGCSARSSSRDPRIRTSLIPAFASCPPAVLHVLLFLRIHGPKLTLALASREAASGLAGRPHLPRSGISSAPYRMPESTTLNSHGGRKDARAAGAGDEQRRPPPRLA